LAEKMQSMDEFEGDSAAEYQKLLSGATFSIASQMTSKTYMQSAANFFDALENPEIAANNMVQMFAGSLIPAGVAEVARQVDPVQRQAYDFVTKWKTRLPFKSAENEPKLDMWAREIKHGSGKTFADVFNPVNITRENITPIDREFNLQGWSIPGEVREFTRDKASISLKDRPHIKNYLMKTERATVPSEMADQDNPRVKKLLKRYGDYTMHDLMNMVVTGNHPLYREYVKKSEGPTGGKVTMLKKIRDDYYEAAKDMTVREFPELEIDILDAAAARDEEAADIATKRTRDAAGDSP